MGQDDEIKPFDAIQRIASAFSSLLIEDSTIEFYSHMSQALISSYGKGNVK